jgi:hypothetical protein
MNNERENYSWGVVQNMIEREVSSAFKIREPNRYTKNPKELKMPNKKELKRIIKEIVQKERKENK